ncbi:hypothetical protein [Nakamurella leprariae]|uniref:Uncharacterized protein n=1 Tax=Nakamurella leprariae TaxID=2803911 RepID=A0A939C2S9_9ACTN|nr:hypothetical protein [Nakamurella leprariae]MBM9468417.1 hypothetical protein [Nakamurella leprariae]
MIERPVPTVLTEPSDRFRPGAGPEPLPGDRRVPVTTLPAGADDRLAALGLSTRVLLTAAAAAGRGHDQDSPFDPPIMPGLRRWAAVVRTLRSQLVPLGWRQDNPSNLPRTLHPDGSFAVVVTTGDDHTGVPWAPPGTRHLKGTATRLAIEPNAQLAFDLGDHLLPAATDELPLVLTGTQTWFLLFHPAGPVVRSELSFPQAISRGRMLQWAERIILPEVVLG